jgi:hypothetical protein
MTDEEKKKAIAEKQRIRNDRYVASLKADPEAMARYKEKQAKWRKKNKDKIAAIAKKSYEKRMAGVPHKKSGPKPKAKPPTEPKPVKVTKPKPKSVAKSVAKPAPKPVSKVPIYLNPNKIQHDIEQEGWREVARFGDRGTEIRAWIKGLVVRYEQISNRRSTYAPIFCDKGRRYKTYAEAQKVARVL